MSQIRWKTQDCWCHKRFFSVCESHLTCVVPVNLGLLPRNIFVRGTSIPEKSFTYCKTYKSSHLFDHLWNWPVLYCFCLFRISRYSFLSDNFSHEIQTSGTAHTLKASVSGHTLNFFSIQRIDSLHTHSATSRRYIVEIDQTLCPSQFSKHFFHHSLKGSG